MLTDLEFYELRYSGKAASAVRGFRAVYLGLLFNCLIMATVNLAACKIAGILFGLERWQTLAFVEVKWRARAEDLATAIDERRLQRVARAAEALVARYGVGAETIRIDVVLLAPGRWPRHMANVWMPTRG